MTWRAKILVLSVLAVIAFPGRAKGQESLTTARELYASAEYASALSMLDGLLSSNPERPDRPSIELYRVFCLVALGRSKDVDEAIERMILRDPLFRPSAEDVPPRLRTTFSDARRKLLPSIIQNQYVAAKAAFDRNDYKEASTGFTQVLVALSDPDLEAEAGESPLSDLRVLATGFNDLAVRNLAPPPAAPDAQSPQTATAESEPPARVAALAPAAAAPAARTLEIYEAEDTAVVQPVVIRQELPPYQGRVIVARSGILEIVIDATGAVESATMVEPVDPIYNRIAIETAKKWLYQPARLDGVPVKFRKRIQITVTPPETR